MNEINQPQSTVQPQTPPPVGPPPAMGHGSTPIYGADSGYKSSGLATALSLMPGLGHIYVGHYQQGFVNVLVIASLIAMLGLDLGSLTPLVAIFMAFYWLYNMIDAGRRASFYNMAVMRNGRAPVEYIPLPDDRASLLAGIALVFFGGVFLLHNVYEFSLEWLEDWWPLSLVILGAYLIYKSLSERQDTGTHREV